MEEIKRQENACDMKVECRLLAERRGPGQKGVRERSTKKEPT